MRNILLRVIVPVSIFVLFLFGPRILIDQIAKQKPQLVLAQQSQAPCQIAQKQGQNICNDNQTYCEDTGNNQSTIFLKHNGRCDPSNGESKNDPRGCVFDYTPISFQAHACTVSSTPQPQVVTCNGRTLTKDQLDSELHAANYPGPYDDINAELAAFNRAACPATTPQPTEKPTPQNLCGALPVGDSQCRNGHQVFCKFEAPECNGNTCIVDTGGTCGGVSSSTSVPTATPIPANTPTPTFYPTHASIQQQSQAQVQNNNQQVYQTIVVNGQTFTYLVTPTPELTATPIPTQTPTPIPTATPTPASTTIGTTTIGVGGGPVAIATATPSIVAVASNTTVKELPETGLPFGALALVGLIPIGWKLRKYGLAFFDISNPHSIWQNRQLKK